MRINQYRRRSFGLGIMYTNWGLAFDDKWKEISICIAYWECSISF